MTTPGSGPPGEPPVLPAGRRLRAPGASFATLAVTVIVAAGTVLAGCSSSSSSPPTSAPAHSATLVIRNFAFLPAKLTVSPGAVVKVFNEDQVTHNLASSHGQFGTGDIPAGQSKTFTAPSSAGTYGYICSIHPYMTGTLVVS